MITRLRYPQGYQFFDGNGLPLALGQLFYYGAGTTTLQDTYSDSAGTVANPNPVVLDGSGRLQVDVYLGSASDYKEVLTTSTGAVVAPWPDDSILRAGQANWNASSGPSQILNKPALATVATSGNYADLLNAPTVFSGDRGSGGTSGLVPAPAAGAALANEFLKADGTWAVPPGGSGSGSTNLTVTETANSVSIASSTGSGASIPAATSTAAGILDSTRAAKIDGLTAVALSGSYNDLSNKPSLAASATTDTTNASNISSGTLAVAHGGTGTGTLTAHGILLGEGTGNVVASASMTAGQLLVGQGATSDPSPQTMGGDATLSSSGSLTVTKTNGTAFATVATSGSYTDLSNKPAIPAPGGSAGQLQYDNGGAFGGTTGLTWSATTQRLSLTSLTGQDGTPVLNLSGPSPVSSILDLVCSTAGTSDSKIMRILSNVQGNSDITNLAPIAYFGSDGEFRTRAYVIISNTRGGTGDSFAITPSSTDSLMFSIWADTPLCMQTRVNVATNNHWSALDHNGKYCFLVGETGNLGWANSATTNTMDAGLSRLAASALAIGNGTAGDYSGNLKLTTLTFADGSSQTSAASTSSNFTGATGSTAGVHGLVPAPAAGQNASFLRGDGSWATVSTGVSVASGKTLTVNNSLALSGTDGKTLTINNSLGLAGTDGTTMTFPSASDTVGCLGTAQTWTAAQTHNANLILGNNKNLQGTLSAGGQVNLLQFDSTNTFYIGSASLTNDIVLQPGTGFSIDINGGNSYTVKFSGNKKVSFGSASTAGLWTFYDDTPTTGDSYICIRDGAARPARIAFGNNSGTYDVAFARNNAGLMSITDASTTLTNYRDLLVRDLYTSGSSYVIRTKAALSNGAGSSAATITNGPAAGNPTKWIPIDDNGTTRYIPAW